MVENIIELIFNGKVLENIFYFILILINKIMATNKESKMSIIKDENIKKVLEAFKSAYRKSKEKYVEQNVKVEDVVSLTEGFSRKNTLLATTVIISVMLTMPPKEFMALMDTAKSISKVKLLEAMKELLKEKTKGADNDIDN